jgi:hypothetical protein
MLLRIYLVRRKGRAYGIVFTQGSLARQYLRNEITPIPEQVVIKVTI